MLIAALPISSTLEGTQVPLCWRMEEHIVAHISHTILCSEREGSAEPNTGKLKTTLLSKKSPAGKVRTE
jgi:hypothetical protein